MNTPLALTTPHITWIGNTELSIERPPSLQPVLSELSAMGYTIKNLREDDYRKKKGVTIEQMEQEGYSLWYASLQGIERGKCGSCRAYISVGGIRSHGHRCELCGAVTYLEMQDGSMIRFAFPEPGFPPPELVMEVSWWDSEHADLYLYPEPQESREWGVLTGEQAVKHLMDHHACWEHAEIGRKALIKVKYADSPLTSGHRDDTIEVRGVTNHYWNHMIVRLWKGKEYREWDQLPVPEGISIYESWHQRETVDAAT